MFFIVFCFAITLLAANDDRNRDRKEELSRIESYELIHFNMDRFASHHQLEFDLYDNHYKVQLVPNDNMIPSQIHSTIGGKDETDDPNTSSNWFSSLTVSCHYKGTVLEPEQSGNSYLSLSLCPNRGIRGSITTAKDEIWIMPAAYYLDPEYDRKHFHELTDQHLVYTSPVSSNDITSYDADDDISVSSRHLLRSSDRNKVELYVMSDPALTKRFKDDYGSNYFQYLKAHVTDLISGVSAKYEAKNWGPAGSIEIRLVHLEVVLDYTGIYLPLTPHFPEMTIGDWTNCNDWRNYQNMYNGGCYITGSADGVHRDKAMISKFRAWINEKRQNQNFDNHLLLVGNKMTGIAGVAYRDGMCDKGYNMAVVNSKHNSLESDTKTVCHEFGHNFGMQHDLSCAQCIMGRWTSWEAWGFVQQAYTQLNDRFTRKNQLRCLRDGVRSYGQTIHNPSSDSNSGGGGGSPSGECLQVSGVNSFMNGQWNANGQVNGRTAYKRYGQTRYIYTALEDDGTKVWTMYRSKSNGRYVNSNYYCRKTFIMVCSGNWYLAGSRMRNSRFGTCGSFNMNEKPQCVKDNTYGDNLCIYNNGSLWNDEENKHFEVVSNECFNDKPMYQHTANDNISYYIYYNEYNASFDSVEVSKQWLITLYGVTSIVAAQCDEEDLLECVEGKWKVLHYNNDSVELMVEESMNICSSLLVEKVNNSMESVFVIGLMISGLVIVVVLLLFAFFMYRRSKGLQMQKTVEFVADDQSEDEEQDIEVHVEETNLVQTTNTVHVN